MGKVMFALTMEAIHMPDFLGSHFLSAAA